MLLAYCEASRCRRQLLLSYFGEASEPCGNCDPCREPSERIDSTEDARKILAAMRATGERFGAIRIIEALADNSRKKEEWQSLIRQMAGDGLLRHDLQGYGGLEMTEKGRALLRGDGMFESRPFKPRERTKRQVRAGQIGEQSDIDQTLIASLKALRLCLARERRVPPYVIFSDRSLIDMAQRRPKNEREFGEVHGVGAAKLKDFAAIFLRAIGDHVA
jgi:ATP-dependent DNA helicase RecQ